jgi:lipoprotein-anchoring transpeptidase ErfK/SrfK
MLEADYNDRTPFDHTHATDMQILNHYNLMHGQVVVVSLVGQALRLYQDGKLVRGFLVTTGRPELPSLPGVWSVLSRESPTIFKSSEPPGSPYWYPDTPINYAILYHAGGYFFHDAWWRADFGPGTQFPHYDSGGDEAFAGSGSHGCVNMQEDQAAWLFSNTNWSTQIVMY